MRFFLVLKIFFKQFFRWKLMSWLKIDFVGMSGQHVVPKMLPSQKVENLKSVKYQDENVYKDSY